MNYALDDELRKASLNVVNRLRSIKHDCQFVDFVASKFPLPVVANERAGSFYVSPSIRERQTVYFKSTDGHYNNWDISMKRLNLHILPLIKGRGGVVIVDATKKGKAFPDSLAKTIPIWIAVMNIVAFGQDVAGQAGLFRSLPSIVAETEAQQINNLLKCLVDKFKSFSVDVDRLIKPFLDPKKPLRPLWVHPATKMFSNTLTGPFWTDQELLELDFTPIVLVSSSFAVNSPEVPLFPVQSSLHYIQGASDDSELWSTPGFTAQHFWAIFDRIDENVSESYLLELIKDQIEKEKQGSIASSSNAFDWIVENRLAIGSRTAADPCNDCWKNFDVIVNCGAEPFQYEEKDRKNVLFYDIYEGKKGQKQLFDFFDPFLREICSAIDEKKRILIHCMQGKDRSVAMAMVLLLRYPDLDTQTPATSLTKIDVMNCLMRIQAKRPLASPSRAYMKKVDLYCIH